MELRVMTYNIHHGKGTDGILDLERIAEGIRKFKVDIVGLNEVDKHFSGRSNFEDQAAKLAELLQMEHYYGASISKKPVRDDKRRFFGNALLSRYPIIEAHNHPFHFRYGVENRSVIETSLQFSERIIKVYVTHLSLNRFAHRTQTNIILKKINSNQVPSILMGDWNMRPGSKPWRVLTEHLQDVWVSSSDNGFTFPSYRPRSRIDYIFVNQYIYVDKAYVVKDFPEASDHLPVVAELQI